MTATQINVVSKGLFSPRWPVQGLVLTVFLCLPGAALLGTQLLFAGQNSGDDRALMWSGILFGAAIFAMTSLGILAFLAVHRAMGEVPTILPASREATTPVKPETTTALTAPDAIQTSNIRPDLQDLAASLHSIGDQAALAVALATQHENHLRRAAEIAGIGYASLTTKDPKFVFCDPRFAAMVGLTVEDILALDPGENLDFGLPLSNTPEQSRVWRSLFEEGAPPSHTFSVRWKDGAERHIQAFFEQVTQPDGSLHINLVAQDITDLRHNEQRANQAERLQTIGKLTGGIAHDFNNILAVISGNLELLVTDLSDEERHICVKHALSAVGRGADLTRQLLAVARDQPLKPEAFQPVLMMAEIVPLLEMSVGVNIKITVEGDGISEYVKADRPQLEACILNLAVNARDAMPEGGTLTLRTGIHTQGPKAMPGTEELAEGTYVTLSAEDTGTGIHPQVAARVFEPFFTTKAIGQGTGIGLSTVLGFAQQSGGTARVHSEIGKGTTVTLYLPRATMVPAPATKKHRRKIVPVLRGVKVLLIEDEVSLAETYCRHLRAQGCTVNHCIDAQHAFEVVANTPDPDLILSDVQLPGPMDGITLTHQLLEKFPTARAILMSGYSDKIAALQDTEGFELATMQKPFTLAALSTSIAKELQAPAKKR